MKKLAVIGLLISTVLLWSAEDAKAQNCDIISPIARIVLSKADIIVSNIGGAGFCTAALPACGTHVRCNRVTQGIRRAVNGLKYGNPHDFTEGFWGVAGSSSMNERCYRGILGANYDSWYRLSDGLGNYCRAWVRRGSGRNLVYCLQNASNFCRINY